MDVEVKNGGAGADIGAHVDQNEQLHTFTISRTNGEDSVRKGNAYNINTGWVALTTATESAVLYLKNEESPVNGETGIYIDAVAIGIDDEGTTTGMSTITIVRNPSTGTIVTNAVDVDMNQNRNFGSNNTLSSPAYKGVEGDTFTNGDDIAILAQQPGTRGYYGLGFELPRGSSIGIKIDTDTSGGTTNIYAALILHRIDGSNT